MAKEGGAPYVAVAGGVNMDIGGRAYAPLVPRDSNPGRVRMSLGGVGRNIAHNLRLLGVEVRLLTALGGDALAGRIVDSCAELGIDTGACLRLPGETTSTYLFLSGPGGDMELALSDMDIYRNLTPAYFSARASLLDGAELVVVDANLPEESIVWLAEHCRAPLFADPVSTAKAVRLRPVLGKLHTLKPNRLEAELLSGVRITDERSLRRCAEALLDTGLKRVFISLGGEGVCAADRTGVCRLPCLRGSMVNTTGCGDAFMAAAAWAYLEGADLREAAAAGLAASAVAMESPETINPALSAEEVRRRMAGGSYAFYDTKGLCTGELRLRLVKTAEAIPEKDWVPAYHFAICAPDGTEMGACDLRLGHNGKLYYGGNIGYRVESAYRGHHYAEKACRLLFELARKHGMDYLYITCSPDNAPSRRTCERLGGRLLEIAELPPDNDMRLEKGETHECIYRFEL